MLHASCSGVSAANAPTAKDFSSVAVSLSVAVFSAFGSVCSASNSARARAVSNCRSTCLAAVFTSCQRVVAAIDSASSASSAESAAAQRSRNGDPVASTGASFSRIGLAAVSFVVTSFAAASISLFNSVTRTLSLSTLAVISLSAGSLLSASSSFACASWTDFNASRFRPSSRSASRCAAMAGSHTLRTSAIAAFVFASSSTTGCIALRCAARRSCTCFTVDSAAAMSLVNCRCCVVSKGIHVAARPRGERMLAGSSKLRP